MGMAAPVTLTARTVIDADGYPVARPRRADGAPRAPSFEAPRPVGREQRPASILAFPQRIADQFTRDDDAPDSGNAGSEWRNAAGVKLPTSAFLAQHIAQERLTEGLTLDPYASATTAYARSGRLSAPGLDPIVSLTV
jgi:hypothetical protein